MKKKIVSLFLVMALMLPMIPVRSSAAAALVVPGGIATGVSGVLTSATFATGVSNLLLNAYEYHEGKYTQDSINRVYNCLVAIIGYGQMPMWKLQKKCDTLNAFSRHPTMYYDEFFQTGVNLGYWEDNWLENGSLLTDLFNYFTCDFDNIIGGWQVVEYQDGQYVIANSDESFMFSDSLGRYPYASDYADTWFPAEDIEAGVVVAPVPEDALNRRLKECRNMYPNSNIYIGTITLDNGLEYKVIYENTGSDSLNVWCDYEAKPYALPLYDTQAGQDRDYNNDVADQPLVNEEPVTDIDENFILQMFPDGTFTWIDNIDFTYDDSNKVYNIDASTSYDIENNTYYNYSWSYTYYIDYTSITYIGQTAEYDKYYEYYYDLPDGRSSADLTAAELEVLNTSIDVLEYARSTDDVSVRALYHFDGNTFDSSYWSQSGDFVWSEGASITYMDVGVFGGALYLSENLHDFSINLPSNLGYSDFTIEFRLYNSATLAPVTDSYVSIYGQQILSFNGSQIGDGSSIFADLSPGVWNAICLMRSGSTLYYYVNGVMSHSVSITSGFNNVINFLFGSEQQTYKYFDELRVTNKALYSPSGYTPSSVPFDTNLTLVLPDSQLPIADSYWVFDSSQENLLEPLGLSNWEEFVQSDYLQIGTSYGKYGDASYYAFPNVVRSFDSWGFLNSGFVTLTSTSTGTALIPTDLTSAVIGSDYYLHYSSSSGTRYFGSPFALSFKLADFVINSDPVLMLSSGNYCFSLVLESGDIFTVPVYVPSKYSDAKSHSGVWSVDCGDYIIRYFIGSENISNQYKCFIEIIPVVPNPTAFVYMELVDGSSTDLSAEHVESVVVMDKDDLRTPSLAVRTDIDITSYQIGGVRPSLPEKGLVWAMVESGRITSLQIYNGQAWEECDGRIWTGLRWIPYYAYDVLLLKDLYDVVGTDPTLNPIYTETGFWTWLQNAWKDMIARLDKLISVSGGGGVAVPDGSQDFPPDAVDPDGDDEEWTIIDLAVTVKDGVWSITKGVIRVGIGGFKGLVSGVSNISGFFDAFDESGILQIMDETGAVTWE